MKETRQDLPEPGLMSVAEVAQYLKLNVYTIYKMTERGELPGTKLGRLWRFKKADIYRWLTEKITREQKERTAKWQKKYDKVIKEKP